MSRQPQSPQEPWENDAVWKLLDASPPQQAGPRFADDVVRLTRLDEVSKPWWQRLFAPVPLTGLAVTSAVVAFAIFSAINGSDPSVPLAPVVTDFSADIELIEDAAETETLLAVVDHLDEFSDAELVRLIGF